MKKVLSIFFCLFISIFSFANTLNFSEEFHGKRACFILFDVNQDKTIVRYNSTHCTERISPHSTFKVPLSLMAFDQKLIMQATTFKWDGKDKGLPQWNQDQNPTTWLRNSVIWVSQELTPKIGSHKITTYLKNFRYGNHDFSGDLGKNNGLMRAWLGSSLKLSANEQLRFLKKLVNNKLPVSKDAMLNTKTNMFLENSPNGWKLYGKTGSGYTQKKQKILANTPGELQEGWFIGFIQREKQKYIFVLNFSDREKPETTEAGGTRAKAMAKDLLNKLELF